MYIREAASGYQEIDRWSGGVGWFAHPEETGRRASHAIRDDDGVWVFEPLDAPGIDTLVADLGEVAGVAVLSDYHARDSATFANRHDVSVHVPAWFERVEDRVDAPIERFEGALGNSGFRVQRYAPFPGWREGIAVRESDGTVYVPEALGTAPFYTVGAEQLGVHTFVRLVPPRDPLGDINPERVLVGHGTGIFDEAGTILANTLDGARRRLLAELRENGLQRLRATWSAAVG